jgi:formate/nitrite transporter FocA (FNT family)
MIIIIIIWAVAWLGLLAGTAMAVSMLMYMLSTEWPESWQGRIAGTGVFTVGLFLILVSGSILFE